MSIEAVNWAFGLKLQPIEKFVLVALANRMNAETGRCDPSLARLSEDTGFSRSSIKRALDRLAALKLIDRETRAGERSIYRLTRSPQTRSPQNRVPPEPGSTRTGPRF